MNRDRCEENSIREIVILTKYDFGNEKRRIRKKSWIRKFLRCRDTHYEDGSVLKQISGWNEIEYMELLNDLSLRIKFRSEKRSKIYYYFDLRLTNDRTRACEAITPNKLWFALLFFAFGIQHVCIEHLHVEYDRDDFTSRDRELLNAHFRNLFGLKTSAFPARRTVILCRQRTNPPNDYLQRQYRDDYNPDALHDVSDMPDW
jgi:hypothetical protein